MVQFRTSLAVGHTVEGFVMKPYSFTPSPDDCEWAGTGLVPVPSNCICSVCNEGVPTSLLEKWEVRTLLTALEWAVKGCGLWDWATWSPRSWVYWPLRLLLRGVVHLRRTP